MTSNTEIWLFIVGTLLSTLGVMAVLILNFIRNDIKDLKKTTHDFNSEMRESVTGLDRRVSQVEGHLGFEFHARRKTNGKHAMEAS